MEKGAKSKTEKTEQNKITVKSYKQVRFAIRLFVVVK